MKTAALTLTLLVSAAGINRDFSYESLADDTAGLGDADGVRLDHIAEMFRLKGNELFGDMRPRSESRSLSHRSVWPCRPISAAGAIS